MFTPRHERLIRSNRIRNEIKTVYVSEMWTNDTRLKNNVIAKQAFDLDDAVLTDTCKKFFAVYFVTGNQDKNDKNRTRQ